LRDILPYYSVIAHYLFDGLAVLLRTVSSIDLERLAYRLHRSSARMPQTEAPPQTAVSLEDHLSRLVAFESTTLPVISLYLNTQPDNHGRDHFEQFIRKEFAACAGTFPQGSVERESFERDTARIKTYLEDELQPSTNGLVLFACARADDFFEALQLEVPIEENRLYVYNQPHLYHLARLDDEYPRYAAVITDANWARIFVFGLGQTIETGEVKGKKVQRVKVGGWSQARYQRRVGNAHHKHIKEIIDSLDRILREDQAGRIVLAGDAAIYPGAPRGDAATSGRKSGGHAPVGHQGIRSGDL